MNIHKLIIIIHKIILVQNSQSAGIHSNLDLQVQIDGIHAAQSLVVLCIDDILARYLTIQLMNIDCSQQNNYSLF